MNNFVDSDLDARINARVAPRHLKEDAINAARLTLSVCWFDAAACSEGLKALRSYRKEWDEEKVLEGFERSWMDGGKVTTCLEATALLTRI